VPRGRLVRRHPRARRKRRRRAGMYMYVMYCNDVKMHAAGDRRTMTMGLGRDPADRCTC